MLLRNLSRTLIFLKILGLRIIFLFSQSILWEYNWVYSFFHFVLSIISKSIPNCLDGTTCLHWQEGSAILVSTAKKLGNWSFLQLLKLLSLFAEIKKKSILVLFRMLYAILLLPYHFVHLFKLQISNICF